MSPHATIYNDDFDTWIIYAPNQADSFEEITADSLQLFETVLAIGEGFIRPGSVRVQVGTVPRESALNDVIGPGPFGERSVETVTISAPDSTNWKEAISQAVPHDESAITYISSIKIEEASVFVAHDGESKWLNRNSPEVRHAKYQDSKPEIIPLYDIISTEIKASYPPTLRDQDVLSYKISVRSHSYVWFEEDASPLNRERLSSFLTSLTDSFDPIERDVVVGMHPRSKLWSLFNGDLESLPETEQDAESADESRKKAFDDTRESTYRSTAIAHLAQLDKLQKDDFARLLDDDDPAVRAAAVRAAGDSDDVDDDTLVALAERVLAQEDDPAVITAAVEVVRPLVSQQTLHVLADALDSNSPLVLAETLRGVLLRTLMDRYERAPADIRSRVEERIRTFVTHPQPEVRAEAVEAAAAVDLPEADKFIETAFDDETVMVREAAIDALHTGRLATFEADLQRLAEEDSSASVRESAESSLRSLSYRE